MTKTLTLSILLTVCGPAFGQCTIAIPGNAILVSTIQGSTPATGQFIWVCDAGLAAVTGNGNTVVVEDLATGTLIGNNNIIVTKSPGTYVSGSNNTVYIMDAANVADLGTNTQIITCPTITFTYVGAPTPGCASVGIAEQQAEVSFSLFPNPVGQELTLVLEGARLQRVRLFDTRGTLVLDRSTNLTGKQDVAKLPAGLYLLVADTDKGPLVRRMVKD